MRLAIDPGADTGWALYSNDGVLMDCGLGVPPYDRADRAVLEVPQVYPKSPVNPNNLITLALRAGRHIEAVESRGGTIRTFLPHEWKQSISKEAHHARLWHSLGAAEQKVVHDAGLKYPGSKRHNILDAVALGQWASKGKKWP